MARRAPGRATAGNPFLVQRLVAPMRGAEHAREAAALRRLSFGARSPPTYGALVFLDCNGARHHYVSVGEGPPVVLVHGLGGSLHAWWGVIDNLRLHHHVVALDLRGFGRTPAGSGRLSVEGWAQDVVALIEALELPPVTLVGHSMGSLVAQHAALERPEAIDNLVLVGGISWFEPPVRAQYEERAERVEAQGLDPIVDGWLEGALSPRTRALSPQLTGLLRDLYLRNDRASFASACRALARAPKIDRSDLGQPTLLVVGDHDTSTPIAMTEELHREIPVSRVRVVPGAAHWVPLEQPDMVATAIYEFLT